MKGISDKDLKRTPVVDALAEFLSDLYSGTNTLEHLKSILDMKKTYAKPENNPIASLKIHHYFNFASSTPSKPSKSVRAFSRQRRSFKMRPRSTFNHTPASSTETVSSVDVSEDNTSFSIGETTNIALEVETASDSLDMTNERTMSSFCSDGIAITGNVSGEEVCVAGKNTVESLYPSFMQTTDINIQESVVQNAMCDMETNSIVLDNDRPELSVFIYVLLSITIYECLKLNTNYIKDNRSNTNREIRQTPVECESLKYLTISKPAKLIANACLENKDSGNCDKINKISNPFYNETSNANITLREPAETDSNNIITLQLHENNNYESSTIYTNYRNDNIVADSVAASRVFSNSTTNDKENHLHVSESNTKHQTGDDRNEERNVSLANCEIPVGTQENRLSTVGDNPVTLPTPNPVSVIEMYLEIFSSNQQATLVLYKRELRMNVVTTDMFDDAIRHSLTVTCLAYSIWYPRNCRLYEWIPVLRGNYIDIKDELHRIE